MKSGVDAREILRALRRYYDGPPFRTSTLDPRPWLVLEEVKLSAYRRGDPDEDSRIDALAVRTRGSSPYLIGHEIKVERRDLEQELAVNDKRVPWAMRCNEFVLVCPVGLTSAEEVEFSAPDLGLLEYVPDAEALRHSRRGYIERSLLPPDWNLVVSLLRSASGY